MNRNFRKVMVLGSLLNLGQAAVAGKEAEPGEHIIETVPVWVYRFARIPDGVWKRAQETAGRIFANAGLTLSWVACPTTDAELSKYPDCEKPVGRRHLVLRLMPVVPTGYAKQEDVSGAALRPTNGGPGGLVVVFFDRVEQVAYRLRGSPVGLFAAPLPTNICTSITLATVIAHELGHLLLGAGSHSKRGIMQPSWHRQDLEDVFWGRLTFTPRQVEQINARLRAWDQAGRTAFARNNASRIAPQETR